MKKILLLIFTGIMAFGFTACGATIPEDWQEESFSDLTFKVNPIWVLNEDTSSENRINYDVIDSTTQKRNSGFMFEVGEMEKKDFDDQLENLKNDVGKISETGGEITSFKEIKIDGNTAYIMEGMDKYSKEEINSTDIWDDVNLNQNLEVKYRIVFFETIDTNGKFYNLGVFSYNGDMEAVTSDFDILLKSIELKK